mgnify:CR=1 FL=1
MTGRLDEHEQEITHDLRRLLECGRGVGESLARVAASSDAATAQEMAYDMAKAHRSLQRLGVLLSLDAEDLAATWRYAVSSVEERRVVEGWLEEIRASERLWRALAHVFPYSFPPMPRDVVELHVGVIQGDLMDSVCNTLRAAGYEVLREWSDEPAPTNRRRHRVLFTVTRELPWAEVARIARSERGAALWSREGARVVTTSQQLAETLPPPFAHAEPVVVNDLAAGGDALVRALSNPRAVQGVPYPGPAPFRMEDAPWFYGRDRALVALREIYLAEKSPPRWVSIEGPFRCGKSSFVQAALIPAICWGLFGGGEAGWATVSFPKGGKAKFVAAVARSLTGDFADVSNVATMTHDQIAFWIAQRVGLRNLLIVIDSLEILIDSASDHSELEEVGAIIAKLLDSSSQVLLITTMHSQTKLHVPGQRHSQSAYPSPQASVASLYHLWMRVRSNAVALPLPLMLHDERLAAISGPATRAGIGWSPGLPERIDSEVRDGNAPFTTVQIALVALWERDVGRAANPKGRTLTDLTCTAMGGVAGAVAEHAESVLGAMGDDDIRRARRVLLQLVRAGRGGTARVELASDALGADVGVASRLHAAGVVVWDEGLVYLAFESLTVRWAWLRALIEEYREFLVARERIEALARRSKGDGAEVENILASDTHLHGKWNSGVLDWLRSNPWLLTPDAQQLVRMIALVEEKNVHARMPAWAGRDGDDLPMPTFRAFARTILTWWYANDATEGEPCTHDLVRRRLVYRWLPVGGGALCALVMFVALGYVPFAWVNNERLAQTQRLTSNSFSVNCAVIQCRLQQARDARTTAHRRLMEALMTCLPNCPADTRVLDALQRYSDAAVAEGRAEQRARDLAGECSARRVFIRAGTSARR